MRGAGEAASVLGHSIGKTLAAEVIQTIETLYGGPLAIVEQFEDALTTTVSSRAATITVRPEPGTVAAPFFSYDGLPPNTPGWRGARQVRTEANRKFTDQLSFLLMPDLMADGTAHYPLPQEPWDGGAWPSTTCGTAGTETYGPLPDGGSGFRFWPRMVLPPECQKLVVRRVEPPVAIRGTADSAWYLWNDWAPRPDAMLRRAMWRAFIDEIVPFVSYRFYVDCGEGQTLDALSNAVAELAAAPVSAVVNARLDLQGANATAMILGVKNAILIATRNISRIQRCPPPPTLVDRLTATVYGAFTDPKTWARIGLAYATGGTSLLTETLVASASNLGHQVAAMAWDEIAQQADVELEQFIGELGIEADVDLRRQALTLRSGSVEFFADESGLIAYDRETGASAAMAGGQIVLTAGTIAPGVAPGTIIDT